MIQKPSARRKKRVEEKLNLVPIMDSVFIFIFFLLMSANFIKIMEVGSDVPIISDQEPPKKEKDPLALSLKIEEKELVLTKGINAQVVKKFTRLEDGQYAFEDLHQTLIAIKKNNIDEETIILEPNFDISYEELVKVMDAVRMLEKTDEALYKKDKDGLDVKLKTLFAKIIFGSLLS